MQLLLTLSLLERQALIRAALILEEFRKVNPEMPLQQALTLLAIAAEPGISITELAKKTGQGLASTSRHAEVLGQPRPEKREGLGLDLVNVDFCAVDRRKKVVNLTAKGQRTIKSIIDLINR